MHDAPGSAWLPGASSTGEPSACMVVVMPKPHFSAYSRWVRSNSGAAAKVAAVRFGMYSKPSARMHSAMARSAFLFCSRAEALSFSVSS